MRTTPTLPKNRVVVQYAVPRRGVPGAAALRAWAGGAGAFPVTLRIVGAREGRRLNQEFRKRNYATNVLSFPYGCARGMVQGDIILCAPVIAREALAQGKTLDAHFAHLTVHGLLHLQGHDHAGRREAARMEALEKRLLAKLGYPDPYASAPG